MSRRPRALWRRSLAATGLSLVPALASCGGEAPALRSALLITLDTTRADALGCYGAPAGSSPRLDAFAARSLLFERAYATAPLTLPSHASMLTGLYPVRHGVRDNGRNALPEAARTAAESAADAGLQTAAFLSASVLHGAFGLDQGFAVYDAPDETGRDLRTHYPSRRAPDVVERAARWLAARERDRGFFLWVHVWDPHAPYEAPARFRRASPYASEVACADDAVGALLDALADCDAEAETTVIVAGDHGEAFGERGETSHGAFCWNTTLRVPLLVRRPAGRGAGARVAAPVSVADVFPTLLDVLGLPPPTGVDGRILDAAADPERGVYFESYYGYHAYGWSPIAGWVDARGKYQVTSRERYHMLGDGAEESEHALGAAAEQDAQRAAAAACRAQIEALLSRPRLAPDEDLTIDPELKAAVAALGYASAGAGAPEVLSPLAPTRRPDALSRAGELRRVHRADGLVNGGRYADAEPLLAEIVAANPGNLWAWEMLGSVRLLLDDPGGAVEPLQRVVAGGRATATTFANLGIAHRASGDAGAALPFLEEALRLEPTLVAALREAAAILQTRGEHARAAELRERLVAAARAQDGRR